MYFAMRPAAPAMRANPRRAGPGAFDDHAHGVPLGRVTLWIFVFSDDARSRRANQDYKMRPVLPRAKRQTDGAPRRGRRFVSTDVSRRVRAPRVMTMVGSSASGTHRSPDYACDRSVRSIRSVSDPIVESDRRSAWAGVYPTPRHDYAPPLPRARARRGTGMNE